MLYAILTINDANKIDCRIATNDKHHALSLANIWNSEIFTLVVELKDGDAVTIDRCTTDVFKTFSKHNITLNMRKAA